MTHDIIILTDRNHLDVSEKPSLEKILIEDDLLKQALIDNGLKVERLSWDDSNFNWSKTRSVIFRSTWDYFERFDEFSEWLKHVSERTRLFNSKTIINWNIDKHYLKDLQDKGITIPETIFIEKGSDITLRKLHAESKWQETVLKPCISGTARQTYRLHPGNLDAHESVFHELISSESMMLSPLQHDIIQNGEKSLVFIKGTYSHAILKIAKKGDFRVQQNFGGTIHVYEPTQLEVEFAQMVVNACPEQPIYARVDIFTDNNGRLAVLEIELVEPELWFRINPKAAETLAKAIKHELNEHKENT